MARKKRIMVVNDHPEFLDLVVEFLTEEGYEVLALPKHQGAFQQIKEAKPDIVISDLLFGNESYGFTLLDMLYLDPETQSMTLILCTAATEKIREIVPSLAAKGIRWLEKPFTLEALVETLKEV
jgi:CheY-like chemotaxis protein